MSSSVAAVQRRTEGLFERTIRRWYEVILRPGLLREGYFDTRAARILGMIEFFTTEEFAKAVPDIVEDIIADLRYLMPTPEQIEGSRRYTTQRYIKLKPIPVFEPDFETASD